MATFPDLGHMWIDSLYPEVPTRNDGDLQGPVPEPIQWELSPLTMRNVEIIPAGEAAVKIPAKTFVCHVNGCSKRYSHKQELKMHIAKFHGSEELAGKPEYKDKKTKQDKPWPCPHEDCKSGYQRKYDLNTHLLTSHANKPGLSETEKAEKLSKPFPCSWPDCKLGFDKRWAINKHMDRKHSGKTYEPKETEEKKSLKIVIYKTNKAHLEEKR